MGPQGWSEVVWGRWVIAVEALRVVKEYSPNDQPKEPLKLIELMEAAAVAVDQ